MTEQITRIITENQDKIEIGTPAKGGTVRVSGDFSKPDEFKIKIAEAIKIREWANAQIQASI